MSVKPISVTKLDGDDEHIRGSKNKQNPSKMFIIGREACFILAIVFTTYAAVLNTNQTNSKGPPPVPFFKKGSLVTDYYNGELRTMLKKASTVELMFIMYYAPWDAESQALRKEFETVAQHHHRQVFFAAINCWQPGSECRAQASKIPILTYPEFIAYPLNGVPVGYEGQRLAGHMIRFINRLIRPIHRIDTRTDFQELKIRYNVVAVGCLEFENMKGGVEYKTIYEAGMKLAEQDTTKDIAISVVTNIVTAASIGCRSVPSIQLYLWNEVLEYAGVWKSDAIAQWIILNERRVATWLSPPGVKSLTFKPYVDDGSVLIMFTPENPLMDYSNAFDLLREVGYMYFNCNNTVDLNEFIKDFSVNRIKMNQKEDSVIAACQRRKRKFAESKQDVCYEIPVQVVENVWINSSSNGLKFKKLPKREYPSWSEGAAKWTTDHPDESTVSTCNAPFKDNIYNFTKSWRKPTTSMLITDEDYRSASALISWRFLEKCYQYLRAMSYNVVGTIKQHVSMPHELNNDIKGLACKTNRTLSFLAMDSNVYQHFADGLGIDLNEYPDRTAVLIFNAEQETVYVMDKPVSAPNLVEFIVNYTSGRIERHLRSEPRSSQPPNRYLQKTELHTNDSKTSINLLELTSQTFRTIALNETQNVVLFYHSTYCAFCHGVSHIYLTVARLLQSVPNLIFARIDGENNDLPWEFTVHHYPSILFLPAYRKSESRVFSSKLPLTVDNLSKFVLANLNMESRLLGMIEICSRWGLNQYMKKQDACLLGVRQESLDMIADTLLEYRTVSRLTLSPKIKQKSLKSILQWLGYLKEIHLQLGVSKISIASELIKEYHSILKTSKSNR